MNLRLKSFGVTANGTPVNIFRLENELLQLDVSDYGVRLVSLKFKQDMPGDGQQLVKSLPTLADYELDEAYLGAVVGRTCNRIADGQFVLNGKRYQLDRNEGSHHLHGGKDGFHNRCWLAREEAGSLLFETRSPDGENGYPGAVKVSVLIRLEGDTVTYEYRATADQPTLVDMTNHAYFCLDDSGSIADHHLIISADHFAPTDAELIPLGELAPVSGTAFNFTAARVIGEAMSADHPQLALAGGFDHSFLLNDAKKPAVQLFSPVTNIEMTVKTDAPAVQFYTGNFLPNKHEALCCETQHLPNACNQNGFKTPLCTPDQPHISRTSFRFGLRL